MAVALRSSHHHRYCALVVRVPKDLLRQIFPTVGVLESEIELVAGQYWTVAIEVTWTRGRVSTEAMPVNVKSLAENFFQTFDIFPTIVLSTAVAAKDGHQFPLWPFHLFVRKQQMVLGRKDRSSIWHWYVAVHSISHGPVEQPVVIRKTLFRVEERMKGRLVRQKYPSLLGPCATW